MAFNSTTAKDPQHEESGLRAEIYFLEENHLFESEKPFAFRYKPEDWQVPQTNMTMKPYPVFISDIRGREADFSLEVNGFEIMDVGDDIGYQDFFDPKLVQRYFRKLEQQLKDRLQARHVEVFRHGLRKRDPRFPVSTGESYDYDQPTSVAHVDTTPEEMMQYVERLGEQRAGTFRNTRCQWINVWKPLKGPLNDWPLTVCDSRSLGSPSNLEAADLLYPDIATENLQVYHRDYYKWYYLSGQGVHEAVVFAQANSESGGLRGVPHCSFFNPNAPEQEPPRESIEVRLLVAY